MKNLDYGIIGNCKSSALVSKTGSIDWCCLPNFDSDAIFAKILDNEKGGNFDLITSEEYTIHQEYLPKTNILVTRFEAEEGAFEIRDFMPRYFKEDNKSYAPSEIVRCVVLLKGEPKFKVQYNPKPAFAKEKTINRIKDNYIKSHTVEGKYDSVYLYSNIDYNDILEEKVITLKEDAFFAVAYHEKILKQTVDRAFLQYHRTYTYWLNWSEKTTSYLYYNKEILRSALTLKMLTYEKSGAVLAAATTKSVWRTKNAGI